LHKHIPHHRFKKAPSAPAAEEPSPPKPESKPEPLEVQSETKNQSGQSFKTPAPALAPSMLPMDKSSPSPSDQSEEGSEEQSEESTTASDTNKLSASVSSLSAAMTQPVRDGTAASSSAPTANAQILSRAGDSAPAPAPLAATTAAPSSGPTSVCNGSPLCPSRTTAEDYKHEPVITLPDTHPVDTLNALKGITLLRTNLALTRAANANSPAGARQLQNILTKTTVGEMMTELQRAGAGAVATGASALPDRKARIVRSGIWDPKLNPTASNPCVNPQDCAKLPTSDLLDSINDQNLPTNQPLKKAHKLRTNPISANPNPAKLVKPQYLTRPVYDVNDRAADSSSSSLSSSLFDSQQRVLSSSLENTFYKYPATIVGDGEYLPVRPKSFDLMKDSNSVVAEADLKSTVDSAPCAKPQC